MANVTPTRGYPYPTPDDARGAGANKIRDLALTIEADLDATEAAQVASVFSSPVPEGVAYVHGGGNAVVTLSGPLSHTGDWSYANGVATYTGPPRPFTITASASLHADAGAAALLLDLVVGGFLRMRAESQDLGGGTLALFWGPGALSWSGVLPTGTEVQMRATAPADTEVWYPTLTAHSIGPA